MPPDFPGLVSWSAYPRLSIDEFNVRFPEVEAREDELDDGMRYDGSFSEYHADAEIIYIEGDIAVSADQFRELAMEPGVQIAVAGSLRVEGAPSRVLYVSGDLLCDSIDLDDWWINHPVGGRIIARDCVSLIAEDHEIMRPSPVARLESRFLFSWFTSLDLLDISPATLVFLMGEIGYGDNLGIPNSVVLGHECVFVLHERFVTHVDSRGSDAFAWRSREIAEALGRGESIYIDGFDPACLPHMKIAAEAMKMDNAALAYLHYKQAAALSPGYYTAWFGMGRALLEASAFEQALPVFREASQRFPRAQTGLRNRAANDAALCALRLGDADLAVAMATLSIDHLVEGMYSRKLLGEGYRLRAEARLMRSEWAQAESDLAQVTAYEGEQAVTAWLLGLCHFKQGQHEQAKALHASAAARSENFEHYYDTVDNLDYLYGAPVRVDWDAAPLASAPVEKDAAYWRAFMRRSDPMKLKQVPLEMRSTALCREILFECGAGPSVPFVQFFPDSAFTREIAEHLVRRSAHNLEWIPDRLIDMALCRLASPDRTLFKMKYLPAQLVDHELCLMATGWGAKIKDLPKRFVDKALCLHAIKAGSYELEEVPAKLVDDDLVAAAIAHGSYRDFERLGEHRTRRRMLEKAIRDYKCALDAIPGYRFDLDLLAFAENLYGEDVDWPQFIARHGQQACIDEPGTDCANLCWCAFWDEPFMLAQIVKPDASLRPWQIPAPFYTQAVADACFEQHPIHLDKLPPAFMNEAMCWRFIRRYPDYLATIPFALRSKRICRHAIKKHPESLPDVPFARRNFELCVAALQEDPEMAAASGAIPVHLHFRVYHHLLKTRSQPAARGWMLVQCGEGALLQERPSIFRALRSFHKVLALTGEGECDDYDRERARYMIGCCHYLRGELEEAARWYAMDSGWTEYPELIAGFGQAYEAGESESKVLYLD